MIPGIVSCVIVLPGELVYPPSHPGEDLSDVVMSETHAQGVFERDGRRLYSVERGLVLKWAKDVALDAQGRTTETVFAVCDVTEVRDEVSPPVYGSFLDDWFSDFGLDVLHAGRMEELFKVAERKRSRALWADQNQTSRQWREERIFNIKFLALFAVETSCDWETGVRDVEDVYFHSEARVVASDPTLAPVNHPADESQGPLL